MAEEVPTLLDMHIPEFRAGYHDGRRFYFQGAGSTDDVSLVDALCGQARDGHFAEGQRAEIAYIIGQLMGSISCNVISRQQGEPDPKEREQKFLTVLRTELMGNPSLETIVALVQSFRSAQDELARLLAGDLYKQMLLRGIILPI